MGDYLIEGQTRAGIPALAKSMRSTAQWGADKTVMYGIVDKSGASTIL